MHAPLLIDLVAKIQPLAEYIPCKNVKQPLTDGASGFTWKSGADEAESEDASPLPFPPSVVTAVANCQLPAF